MCVPKLEVWERDGDQLIGHRYGGTIVAPYNMSAKRKTHFGWIEEEPQLWALLLVLWIWAIWSCAEYWRRNPNYSYGWIVPVLTFVYAARRLALTQIENVSQPVVTLPSSLSVFFGIVAGAVVFGLEFARVASDHRHLDDRVGSNCADTERLLVRPGGPNC